MFSCQPLAAVKGRINWNCSRRSAAARRRRNDFGEEELFEEERAGRIKEIIKIKDNAVLLWISCKICSTTDWWLSRGSRVSSGWSPQLCVYFGVDPTLWKGQLNIDSIMIRCSLELHNQSSQTRRRIRFFVLKTINKDQTNACLKIYSRHWNH